MHLCWATLDQNWNATFSCLQRGQVRKCLIVNSLTQYLTPISHLPMLERGSRKFVFQILNVHFDIFTAVFIQFHCGTYFAVFVRRFRGFYSQFLFAILLAFFVHRFCSQISQFYSQFLFNSIAAHFSQFLSNFSVTFDNFKAWFANRTADAVLILREFLRKLSNFQ